jgi:hypothetical protein
MKLFAISDQASPEAVSGKNALHWSCYLMRTMIMACQTLREELRLAIEQTGVDYPVLYIESGLHNQPEILRQRIQSDLDKIDNVDIVLLVFGYCGNSLLGIKSSRFTIVIPKIDDCIPLLLGSADARRKASQEMGTYFLTKGWLDYENNLLKEYERCVERFGETRALRLMKTMMGNYERFMVIDTGAYAVESVTERTKAFADKLAMRHEIAAGSLRLFHKLLLGQWDEEFIVLAPGQEITLSDICSGDNGPAGENQLAFGLKVGE